MDEFRFDSDGFVSRVVERSTYAEFFGTRVVFVFDVCVFIDYGYISVSILGIFNYGLRWRFG